MARGGEPPRHVCAGVSGLGAAVLAGVNAGLFHRNGSASEGRRRRRDRGRCHHLLSICHFYFPAGAKIGSRAGEKMGDNARTKPGWRRR